MSITSTTLSAALGIGDTTATVASTAGFPKGSLIQIDSEFMPLTSTTLSGSSALNIRRGDQGTAPAAHASGARVLIGQPSDFPAPAPGQAIVQPYAQPSVSQTYTAAGALSIPTTKTNTFIELLTGTAGAFTLADPTSAQEGQEVTIMAADAQAYTVTNTTGFNNGSTASDVATFGGTLGNNFRIKAVNKIWTVLYLTSVTLG